MLDLQSAYSEIELVVHRNRDNYAARFITSDVARLLTESISIPTMCPLGRR